MIQYPLRTRYQMEKDWIKQRRMERFINILLCIPLAAFVILLGVLAAGAI